MLIQRFQVRGPECSTSPSYLCSKLSIRIPYLLPFTYSARGNSGALESSILEKEDVVDNSDPQSYHSRSLSYLPVVRNQAAAPPAYFLILPLVPVSVATYVASTRFSDF